MSLINTPNSCEGEDNGSILEEFYHLLGGDRETLVSGQQPETPTSVDSLKLDSLKSARAKLWAVSGDSYIPCEEATSTLPPGHFLVEHSMERGVYLRKYDFKIDDLIPLPDAPSEEVIKHIDRFWKLEHHFRQYGFLWKRGILLWGPPASGKTSTIQIVAQNIIGKGGLVIYVDSPKLATLGLHIIRKVEPRRPILAILEDIDATTHRYGEAELLSLLDGEQQIDNIVYIATTNYPERLDRRLMNRPSRFDIIQKIGMPHSEARRVYLRAKSKKLADNQKDMEKWVADTDGFSVAHIKELVISVEVFEVAYEEALERLKIMLECNSCSEEFAPHRISGFAASALQQQRQAYA